MITEADRQEIRATIAEGQKTGRWAEPGNREWTTKSGLRVGHGEEDGQAMTLIWAKDGPLIWGSDHHGPI